MHVPWSGQPKASHPPFLHRSFVIGTVGPQPSTVKVSETDRKFVTLAVFVKVPHCPGITSMVATKGTAVPLGTSKKKATGAHVTVPSLSLQVGCGTPKISLAPVADAETNCKSASGGKVSVILT
jgi:hypothetical protein